MTSVTIFPSSSPAAASCGTDGVTSCCGPGAAIAAPAGDTIETLTGAVRRSFGGKVEVDVATYGTQAEVDATIGKLNAVLAAGGKEFEVTLVNFYTFVESVAPIVVVGDQILCTRRLPTWEELRDAIEKVNVSV